MKPSIAVLTETEWSQLPTDEEQGFGCLQTEQGALPLKAMDVQARIEGLLAEIELSQTFVNTHAQPVEATYIFPLPDRAALLRFRMDVGDRVVEGVLQERGQARQTYEQALRQGHRAAIAEEERPGVFTLRVGNLLPGEQARIRLTLAGPVQVDHGEVTFRFPLVVAPRYIPGMPLDGASVGAGSAVDTDAVPDASRISPPVLLPGYPNPVRLALSVDILPTEMPIQHIRSSLHGVLLERDERGKYRIALQPGERLNRDFVLRYQLGGEGVQTSLQLVHDATGDEGTFLLTLMPPARPATDVPPRDIIFVLDRSGSMGGWKMVAARRALAHLVDSLTERDRFTIYAFDNTVETPSGFPAFQTVHATQRHRSHALEFLARIEARGGTELAQPLSQAVANLKRDGMRCLVLLTDGQVGNEDQILQELGQRLQGIRIFTLGIDQAVNEAFLKRLAGLGGGSCDVVESEQRLDEVMYKIHRRIGAPTLSQLRLDFAGLPVLAETVTPRQQIDLFAGVPVMIQGRYRSVAEGSLIVNAIDEAGRPWSRKVSARPSKQQAAHVVWARQRLRELEDRYVCNYAEQPALEREIVALSLKHSVLCRFTAYVAVDRREVVNEGGQQQQIVQAVEMPAGWQLEGQQLLRAAPAAVGGSRLLAGDACVQNKKDKRLGDRAVKKMMLAKQVLDELNVSGRVSKKTQLAMDDAARFVVDELPPADATTAAAPTTPPPTPPSRTLAEGALQLESLLPAYQQRARAMSDALLQAQAGSDADQRYALGVLAIKLDELLQDMRSIGVPDSDCAELAELLAQLRRLLAEAAPAEVAIAAQLQAALDVLERFAPQAVAVGGA